MLEHRLARPSGLLLLAVAVAAAVADSLPEVQARYTRQSPKIDGVLEDVWGEAVQVTRFIQRQPCYGEPASESTAAFLLHDAHNLYVAFRCTVKDMTAVHARLSEVADAVQVFLDTFDDDASCYVFSVRASGTENDYRLTDDGRWTEQWDGVWHSAVRRYSWGYAVEMAIPFKTLRYDAARDRWGIDFSRLTIATNERSFWSSYDKTGFRVSRMGRLAGMQPGAPGLHLEAYPVGVFRLEQDSAVRLRPSGGLNLSWLPLPTTNIQLTTFPDFAEIEADPYRVNLTKYELWLEERRPFFVEAQETFGTGYQPLQLFYSRRIGRALPGNETVPTYAGAKFTGRFGPYSVGGLGALTGRTGYEHYGESRTEPASYYTVASLRRVMLTNSEAGLLYVGKDNESFHNHAVGLDAVLRFDPLTAKLFGAGSQRGDSLGHAVAVNANYRGQRYAAYLTAQRIDSLFDVNGTGYTGWRGQNACLSAGPVFYNTGPFQQGNVQLVLGLERAWDEPGYSKSAGLSANGSFQNRSYASVWANANREWEQDTLFWSWDAGMYAGTDYSRPVQLYLGADWTSRAYNYRRGAFAPNASAEAELYGRIGDHLSLGLAARPVFEFQPGYELTPREDVMLVLEPKATVTFTPKIELTVRGEGVFGYDPEGPGRYRSYRAGLLYTWTFRPRSTLHLAFDQQLDNSSGRLSLLGRTGVAKLRYLFIL